MFRLILFVTTLFLSVATIWYNYTSFEARQRVPAPLREVFTATDTVVASSMSLISDRVAPAIADSAGALAQRQEESTLVLGHSDGIITVYQDLTGADLTAGRFDRTLFLRAKVDNANFSKAYLRGTLLDGASAKNAMFGEAILADASARVADFSGAVFHTADLTGASLQGATFDSAIISGSDLGRAQLTGASLNRTVMRGGRAVDTRFINAQMEDARFEGIDLRRAVFDGATLTGAVFEETPLHGSRFDKADLTGADLRHTTGLNQMQIATACGDKTTLLPQGLVVAACEPVAEDLLSGLLPEPDPEPKRDLLAQRLDEVLLTD